MTSAHVVTVEGCLRLKNRILGIGWHPDPERYFGAGGVEGAERLCAEANDDFLGFIRPPEELPVTGLERRPLLGNGRGENVTFDSPRPSGRAANDRVEFRVYRPAGPVGSRNAVVFHHPIYQRRWSVWEWFLADLIERMPVVMMAGPYHFGRVPPGEYAGESVCNPNPWKLFDAVRQWCWDQRALLAILERHFDLRPRAVIGFSFGAFQSLLAASAGFAPLPVVSIASTNHYAHGVFHGVLGRGIRRGMEQVGIDEARLTSMTASLQLERWVTRLPDHPVLYIAGVYDRVDPPPSLERLEAALRPTRSVHLPAGHATIVLQRRRICREIGGFLGDLGIV